MMTKRYIKRTITIRHLSMVVLLITVYTFFTSCTGSASGLVNIGTNQKEGTVTFSAEDGAVFAANAEYIILAGKREVQIYNENGKRVYYNQTQLNEPEVLANGSFFLVYDKNGSSCFLFKNEKCIAELQQEYAIYAACLDSSGSFALITRTYASASAVLIYDASGKLKNSINRSDYTIDCYLSSSGRLVLLTLDAIDGEWVTAVTMIKIGSGKTIYEKRLKYVYPYQCTVKGNRIAVVCSDGVHIFDTKGKNHLAETGNMSSFSSVLQNNGQTVLLNDKKIVFCDVKGKVREYSSPVTSIDAAALCGNWLFLTNGRSIVRVNLNKGASVTGTVQDDFNGLLLKGTTGRVYLTSSSSFILFNVE